MANIVDEWRQIVQDPGQRRRQVQMIKQMYASAYPVFLQMMTYLRIKDMIELCKLDAEFNDVCLNDRNVWDYYATRVMEPEKYENMKEALGFDYHNAGEIVGETVYQNMYPQLKMMSLKRQLLAYAEVVQSLTDMEKLVKVYKENKSISFGYNSQGRSFSLGFDNPDRDLLRLAPNRIPYASSFSVGLEQTTIGQIKKHLRVINTMFPDKRVFVKFLEKSSSKQIIYVAFESELTFSESQTLVLALTLYFMEIHGYSVRLVERTPSNRWRYTPNIREPICSQCNTAQATKLCQKCNQALCNACVDTIGLCQ